jgi:hypothetical protein
MVKNRKYQKEQKKVIHTQKNNIYNFFSLEDIKWEFYSTFLYLLNNTPI